MQSKFQGLSQATEFRLYVYAGDKAGYSATLFDKVLLKGKMVDIPEPSLYGLLLGSFSLLAVVSRRHRA